MRENEDLYRILQVHYQAEPDVIEGAFKKLVKKYHPDLNPSQDAAEAMKEINQAYQILSDPVKRRDYHQKWLAEHRSPATESPPQRARTPYSGGPRVAGAQKVLESYFKSIIARDFDGAYRLVSETDQANISPDDFRTWQNEVAKVFELKQFRCEVVKNAPNVLLRGVLYPEVVEFQTTTVEKNIVMERTEQDCLIKKIILEKGNWRVFLGYDELQPYIDKFQHLAELLTAKSVIQDLFETRGKSDPLTGLPNLRGFLEQAEKEASRQQRYGNIFSVIRCELVFHGLSGKKGKGEEYLKYFGKLLAENLRQLDIIGRTDEFCFTVLLPETKLDAGLRVADKIRRMVLLGKNRFPGSEVGMSIGLIQFSSGTLTDTLRQADFFLNLAKQSGTNRIASPKGVS